MSWSREPEPEVEPSGWFRQCIRLIVTLCLALSLRWPLPVFLSSIRGEGATDGVIGAYLASLALGVLGIPGFLAALWGRRPAQGEPVPRWVRLGLVATLASSLSTGGWIAVAIHQIGATLDTGEICRAPFAARGHRERRDPAAIDVAHITDR